MKNKKAGILGIIGLLIIVIGIGVASYENFIKEKNQTSDEPIAPVTKDYEELDVNDSVVQELFLLTRVSTESEDVLFANSEYENFYYRQDNVIFDGANNQFKLYLAFLKANTSDCIMIDDITCAISSKVIEEEYYNIFGKTDDYINQDIPSICPNSITYDNETDEYSFDLACGSEITSGYINKLIEARKYSDRIEIYEKVVFFYDDSGTGNRLYFLKPGYKETLKVDNNKKFEIDDYLSKLYTYKYTFIRQETQYTFSGVSLEK